MPVLTKKQKAEKIKIDALKQKVKSISKFCTINPDQKNVTISHPDYDKLSHEKKLMIADVVSNHGFYIQWDFFFT